MLLEDLIAEWAPEKIHALMEQYLEGNSGFEDGIWEWIEQITSTETHWRTIVDCLESLGDRYYQSLILDIYRYKLDDAHAYEQRRAQQLRYGSDYAEYALFFMYGACHLLYVR